MLNQFRIIPTIRTADLIEVFDFWGILYVKHNATPLVEYLKFPDAKCKFKSEPQLFKCESIYCDTEYYDTVNVHVFNTNEHIGVVRKLPFRDISMIRVEENGHALSIMKNGSDIPWITIFV